MRSVLQCLFLLAAVSFSALANPTDPEILIDEGFGSLNISTDFNALQPDGTNPSISLVFKNDTAGIVTSLTFDTTIKTHLSAAEIATGFGCQPDVNNYFVFFLSCNTLYDASSGELKYQFFGVRPPDGDENFPIDHDNEAFQYEGIPVGGEFQLTLMGWTTTAAASDGKALFDGVPKLSNGFTAPEPSQIWLLVVQGLLLVSVAGIIRRRAKRKETVPSA